MIFTNYNSYFKIKLFYFNTNSFKNFLHVYNLIMFNKYNNIFLLIQNNNYKFIWSDKIDFNYLEISLNYITLKNNFIKNSFVFKNNTDNINEIIIFKKKCSLFKKVDNYEYSILNKSNMNVKKFNKYYQNSQNKNHNLNTNFKNIDLVKNFKKFITLNRNLLKKFFQIKNKKVFSFNKFIKNICNFKKFNLFFNIEFSLLNSLLKLNFFFNEKDVIWFIKNKLITVNGLSIKNENFLLKPFDAVNIAINNNYYYFYREKLDKILLNSYKIKFKFWSIQKNRINNFFLKENYPKYINNYKYFNSNIPVFFEVDYICMSFVILNYNLNTKNLDYFNFKNLNLYINRLYNWKYII